MDRQGIKKAITSISSPGIYFGDRVFRNNLARRCNKFSAELCDKYPKRFGAFAILPLPDIGASLIELEHAIDTLNLDGVVIHSNINGRYIGDPEFDDLLLELNRRNAVVFIHPNSPPEDKLPMSKSRAAALEFVFDTTRLVANLIYRGILKRYPDINFILSHAGGTVPYLVWRISFGKKRVINQLKKLYYDIALSATPYVFPSLLELVDPSHILFGSDHPFLPEPLITSIIREFENYQGFNANIRKIIERENALALFPHFK